MKEKQVILIEGNFELEKLLQLKLHKAWNETNSARTIVSECSFRIKYYTKLETVPRSLI